ncbi:non-hydrolyzing UDP-N-acetylglucosamine 2-epimerase [Polycladomyces subterraneus]|uniref:UDP-N-acetylglucosamine 2-epimerase (non-hydrolyzing) n=1 Tax=Polycladomyces subterraneus TaxID=1016997 RepID=A0ABT8IL32_9BACL|nr:UDP-N-acetylglucosamine 2-epimerase (non-hydrolyzing) [Polycladomyces subterraneus]MDN4593496.1 UDP-N-acetylglucosamine 2-epimerase (non-hydrolyzing) [Polycladomyces subterraneus]
MRQERIKIMSIFGTRPEAVKMAPLILEMQKNPLIQSIVTVSAQHREMLDKILNTFGIVPDFDLDIMKNNQTLPYVTKEIMSRLEPILIQVKPDLVLIHGDTTTALISALIAFYNKIPIGHVEAGLRTRNKYSPFPEELNRRLIGVIADLHFAPTAQAAENLLSENIHPHAIFVTGNTVIDALKTTVRPSFRHEILDKIGNHRLILLTTHRRENIGNPMRNIFRAIKRIVNENDHVQVVYPVHPNPAVMEAAHHELGNNSRIHLIHPLNVEDFHNIAARSYLILTDSGGIQEEAPSLGIPVLVLRDTTERPEGVKAGTLKVAGTSEESVYESIKELLNNRQLYDRMANAPNPYGDGTASQKIIRHIIEYFKGENRP